MPPPPQGAPHGQARQRPDRAILSIGACALAITLVAPAGTATASNRSIFSSTQVYVLKLVPHQNAFFQKFNGAGDYAGALGEANFVSGNAGAARAALQKEKASNRRGKKGKRILLAYWIVKKQAAQQLILAAQAGMAGDLTTARAHLDQYTVIGSRATKLLIRGVAFVKP